MVDLIEDFGWKLATKQEEFEKKGSDFKWNNFKLDSSMLIFICQNLKFVTWVGLFLGKKSAPNYTLLQDKLQIYP